MVVQEFNVSVLTDTAAPPDAISGIPVWRSTRMLSPVRGPQSYSCEHFPDTQQGEKSSFFLLDEFGLPYSEMHMLIRFFSQGEFYSSPPDDGEFGFADFIISRLRQETPPLLTPANRRAFLYDRDGFGEYRDRVIENATRPCSVCRVHDEHPLDVSHHESKLFIQQKSRDEERVRTFLAENISRRRRIA